MIDEALFYETAQPYSYSCGKATLFMPVRVRCLPCVRWIRKQNLTLPLAEDEESIAKRLLNYLCLSKDTTVKIRSCISRSPDIEQASVWNIPTKTDTIPSDSLFLFESFQDLRHCSTNKSGQLSRWLEYDESSDQFVIRLLVTCDDLHTLTIEEICHFQRLIPDAKSFQLTRSAAILIALSCIFLLYEVIRFVFYTC